MVLFILRNSFKCVRFQPNVGSPVAHGLRTPREKIAFTAQPKIQSQSHIFRYDSSIFCLPHRPNFSDIFDLCLHWVSVVRGAGHFFGLEKRSRFDLNCPRTGSNCFQKPFVCRNTEGKNSNILVGELLELLMQGRVPTSKSLCV